MSGSHGSRSAEAARDEVGSPSDPLERFRQLVENLDKGHTSRVARSAGFVAVVRMAQSLETLQAACLSLPRDYQCITLRYSVESRQAFGTLLRAAMLDLAAILSGAGNDVLGQVRPSPDHGAWARLGEGGMRGFLGDLSRTQQGTLDARRLRDLFLTLTDPLMIPPGLRLVILGEVLGADADEGGVPAWNAAAELLFRQLPERVGLVLSGAPQGFVLPQDPVHFMEIPELANPGASAASTTGVGPVARFQAAELVPDVPSVSDHLDRETYATSLATFLLHPQTAPPITIGLYGRWGAGKSSFWQLLQRHMVLSTAQTVADAMPRWRRYVLSFRRRPSRSRLSEYGPAAVTIDSRGFPMRRGFPIPFSEAEELAQQRIVTVMFNAWQYDDAKQTWAGLASTISGRLEKALPPWRRQWMRLKYAWRTNRSDVLLNFGLPLLLLALAGVVLLPWLTPERVGALAPNGDGKGNPLQGLLKSVLPAGSLLLLVWAVGWRLVEVLKPVSERVAGYLKRADYRADMGYQHKVIDDLKFLLRELEAARPGSRVVVYIDDLDRCSDEKIVEILRATILILADCKLFVIFGMDTEMIRRAIVAHYEKMKVPLADPHAFAESYLRKIVQIGLYLPKPCPSAASR